MKLFQMILLIIQLTGILSKKKRKGISSESIENILYYKDCNHKQIPTETPVLRSPPQQQQCKMCCTMCCGDQCVDTHQMKLGRQAQEANQIEPKAIQPVQPELRPREKRKKLKLPLSSQPPISGRRGLGFTRENIKSLISQDEDIRKILKDLVRVTMQKVDLMQLMNNKQNVAERKPEQSAEVSGSVNDL